MPGKSKNKGGAFERKIAKVLSSWLTGGQDTSQLIRSVSSGGWAREQQSEFTRWRNIGDLAPNGLIGDEFRRHFAVECKHRRTIDYWQLWTSSREMGTLGAWWKKLLKEVDGTHCAPMLIFRENKSPIMMGLRYSDLPPLYRQVMIVMWMDLAIIPLTELLRLRPKDVIPTLPTLRRSRGTSARKAS